MSDLLDRLRPALADRYTIEREIGSGGMAIVYLAHDVRNDRRVAVKVLRPELAASLGAERFLREIKIAAQLQHPHILPLYDSGQADGFLFYVMPYVEGQSLRARLSQEGELPVTDAVKILREVVDALAYAHGRGLVHRDIKPDNVLLSGRHALVTDFGVAKAVSEATGRQQLTTAGVALGTPAYMAPEQGAADSQIDQRADLYSVGIMAYEMLTGRPPFSGPTAQSIIAAHMTEVPPPVTARRSTCPPGLSALVMRCLEKKPADRWQSAEELLPQLEALATPGGGTTPAETRPVVALGREVVSRRALVVAGLVVAVVGAGGWMLFNRSSSITLDRMRRVTDAPGLEIEPAISPDGKLIAYAAGPLNGTRIHVQQIAGGRTIHLTDGLPGVHRSPRWSPDGSRIAWASVHNGRTAINVIPALGGSPRRLLEVPGRFAAVTPTWSPDGRSIMYADGRTAVYVMPADGGSPRVIADSILRPHSPAWSPDGTSIVLVSGNPTFLLSDQTLGNVAPASLGLLSPGGGGVERLTDGASMDLSPVWLPGSREMLFLSNQGGARDVYALRLRNGKPRGPAPRITTGLEAQSISLSNDGKTLAYSVFSYDRNIWSVSVPRAGSIATSYGQTVTVGNQVIESVRGSFDGGWIAFSAQGRSGNSDIFKVPSVGGQLLQLTTDPSGDFCPSWSPDGHEIAFHSVRSGTRQIYVMSAEGGAAVQVTDQAGENFCPDWAPDGRRLVFESDKGTERELTVVARANGTWEAPQRLVRSTIPPSWVPESRWSPDGRLIAYLSSDGLRVISPDGTVSRLLVPIADGRSGETFVRGFAWSRSGREMYYLAFDAESRPGVWSVPATGGPSRLVFQAPGTSGQPERRLDATGDRLLLLVAKYESDIWVADVVR